MRVENIYDAIPVDFPEELFTTLPVGEAFKTDTDKNALSIGGSIGSE